MKPTCLLIATAIMAFATFDASAVVFPMPATIHVFSGPPDGSTPWSGLTPGPNGSFYGTTYQGGSGGCVNGQGTVIGCGAVYQLSPVAGGSWQVSVIYSFQGGTDGANPLGGALVYASGVLIGTTGRGGTANGGTAYKLVQGTSGWSETVIHTFGVGRDGAYPQSILVADSHGVLYGTTTNGGSHNGMGTVYELIPPPAGRTAWTEKVLFNFNGGGYGSYPYAGLTPDGKGGYYGTTLYGGARRCTTPDGTQPVINGCGVVFDLSPPATGSTAWTIADVHAFMGGKDGQGPLAGVTLDPSGNLYGTTSAGGGLGGNTCINPGGVQIGCGVAYQLKPPAAGSKAWIETILYRFDQTDPEPFAGLTLNPATGAVYGVTSGMKNLSPGSIFELQPPAKGKIWSFASYNFGGANGNEPIGNLLLSGGVLYGTTAYGGSGIGTIFTVTP